MIFLTNIDINRNELQNVVIQPLAVPPANPKLGQLYCDSTTKRIKMYDGTQWNVVGAVIEEGTSNGQIKIDGVDMTVYTLPAATASSLGGIKVGQGLSVDTDGTLSTNFGPGVQSDWNETDTSSDAYIKNKPSKLSDFTNDENFIDNTVSNLANYYLKSETYTQSEVNGLIAGLALIDIQVVDELPETGKKNVIYLVAKVYAQSKNVYDEYVWTGTAFEKIGDTQIDLSNYLTKTGDASSTTVTFTAAETRQAPATGDALNVIVGKVVKYFGDLANVAFSGSYTDLSNQPNLVKSQTVQMTSGTQKSVTVVGEKVLDVLLTDATTHEVLTADVTINGLTVTVTIAAAYANGIDIQVLYL